ncbi:hypothetical protein ACHAXN_007723 [Cyclotella atomus]
MPLITTRSRFDVRVGSMHTLEVILQIRSSDLNWWNSNLHHEKQLYKLIGRRIIPEELNDEILGDTDRLKTVSGEIVKKKKVVVGEVNLKKLADKTKPAPKKRGKQTTKEMKMPPKKAKTEQLMSKQNTLAASNEDTESKDKRPKLLRETGKWVMGKSMQACYVMEDIDRTASCSMAFRPMKKVETQEDQSANLDLSSPKKELDSEKLIPLATFRSWNKLSKRLNVWVFKFDPDDPTDLSVSEDGGFPRPELLPLSDIFRQV